MKRRALAVVSTLVFLSIFNPARPTPPPAETQAAPIPPTNAPIAPPPALAPEPAAATTTSAPSTSKTGGFLQRFGGGRTSLRRPQSEEVREFNLDSEEFYIFIPPNHTGHESFGLLVFLNPGDTITIPAGWDKIVEKRKLLYVAPQHVGNDRDTNRRIGMTTMAIQKMAEQYKIDPKRIYVSGFSGGARIASFTGMYHPDLVSGVIGICGAQFWKRVPKVASTQTDEYGYNPLSDSLARETRRNVAFAIVTGPGDFRHGNLLDLYNGGFEKEQCKAKLFDIPGMGHAVCSPEVLDQTLDFIESQKGG